MTRYKATISYDGTLFAGFQRQPHARSVQEEIEKTLMRLNQGNPVTIHGAGRTDAGVHALGQVIHLISLSHGMRRSSALPSIPRPQRILISSGWSK